ncbi:MAG TPA: zf-HC2 domain-containing protein [Kofleriaceae bacterium]
MSLCESIDTLAMAFLDDELVAEERRELELHLLNCTSCRHHIDGERADLSLIRKALVAPPAPDLVKAKIARALDEEDRAATRSNRLKWTRYVLPGGAIAAAAAAIVAFVAIRPAGPKAPERAAAVAQEVVRQQRRALPLEVEGGGTRPWLAQHFAPIAVPEFDTKGVEIELAGARMSAVAGYDALFLQYLVHEGQNRFTLTAVVMLEVPEHVIQGGRPVRYGDRLLHVHDANGIAVVTYVDEHRTAYTFTSKHLDADELVKLVVSSDLIRRAEQAR